MERPANIYITPIVPAWRAALFARQVMNHRSRAPEVESAPPQAARGHMHRRHALPRLCVMSSVTLPVALCAALGRVPCIHHMKKRASMRVEVLMDVANGCRAVTQLLLTRLEFKAHRGPPSSRRHPRERKP